MKRLILFSGIIGIIFGLSLTTLTFAQDSTKTRARMQKKEQIKIELKDKNQIQHGYHFVDENGDGYNDNAPDHDGDGIPNGLDTDYTGSKNRAGKGFIDLDGDGINDNVIKNKNRKGGYGPGDGTGNQGVRPQDGSGYGPGSGTGNCDGTGPKGKANRGGSKK